MPQNVAKQSGAGNMGIKQPESRAAQKPGASHKPAADAKAAKGGRK